MLESSPVCSLSGFATPSFTATSAKHPSVFTLTQLSPGSRVCILPSGFPALRYSRRAPTYTPLSRAASSTWFGGSFSVPETETPHTKPDICQ